MANVLLKSIKFTRIINGRLSFSCVKPYLMNKPPIVRSYKQTRQAKAYATAAYKLAPVEETAVKQKASSSDLRTDIKSFDQALADIDFNIRRNGRTQLKNVQQLFSSINGKDMTTSTHGLYLIRCCKYCFDAPPSERVQLVNQIWNRYQELGMQFDISHYNALLDVHVSNGYNFDPVDILASIEDVNLEPNKATYMLIMKKYCLDGNINGASEILVHMKEKGLPADEKVFNYLIEGHLKNKDFTGAQDMIEVMKTSDLQLTAETHTILACGYASVGDKDKMISCLEQCGPQNSAENYLKVIIALADSGNHQYIDDVMTLIKNPHACEQEFINASVQLIHKGHIETAYKLSIAAYSRDFQESVNIFVKQLIKVGTPVAEVIRYCERILSEDLQRNIFTIAAKAAAEYGNQDHAFQLFKKMLENGHYLRTNNFWPLITSLKGKSSDDMWLILKKMSEFGLPADFTTYYEKIYPSLQVLNVDDILQNVKDSDQSVETASKALFLYCCTTGKIHDAVHLINKYDIKISNKLDVFEFVDRITDLSREELNKYLKVLKYILEDSEDYDEQYVQGRLLAALIVNRAPILEELLNKYQELKFSPYIFNHCERELLQRHPARLPYLRKLREINSKRRNLIKDENMSVEDENNYLTYLQNQGMPCRPFLSRRLLYHIKIRNTARVSELLTLFDELKIALSPILLSNLTVMHCMSADLEKATITMNKLKNDFPDFKLEMSRSLEYVILLLRHGKLEESAEALKNFVKDAHTEDNNDLLFRTIKKLNVILCDMEDIEFVKKMQNLLMPLSNKFTSKKLFLENGIHFHLQRNDIPKAFEEFKNIILSHRVPVYLNSFLTKCIILDEKAYIQKVIDLTTTCSGKSHALLELAVAYIDTKNTDKAAKIIESLGKETDLRVLESICMTLNKQNKLHELEQLIAITGSLTHVDREKLYCIAFKTCADRGDFKRAIDLFDKLKTEIPQPKAETITFLEELLEKNKQPLSLNLLSKSAENPITLENTKAFMEQLEARNAEAALKELSSLKKGYIRTLSVKSLTDLVSLCLENKCENELALNVQAMSYIIENARDVLTPLLEKFSDAGDIEKFIAVKNFMPDFSLMRIGFNTNFCKAYISSGRHDELLTELELHSVQKNKLFATVAFEELLKFPELRDRIHKLAEKYNEVDYNLPMACVWAYYFSTENFEKADEIFKKNKIELERVSNLVLKSIKENENVNLAKKYVDFVKDLNIRVRPKEKAYGAAIDLMVTKGMYDEAAALVVESEQQNLLLHKYYLSTLVTLKNALEKEDKPVPFSVPIDASSVPESNLS